MSETKKIWFGDPTPASIEWMNKNTLSESLDILITEIGSNFLKGTMPVNEKTKQPFGLLHGGASVALAETLGSVASYLVANPEYFVALGVEINANHTKAVSNGLVTGVCVPLHIGGRTHVWEIKIYDEQNNLCCVSRFTCTIYPKNKLPL